MKLLVEHEVFFCATSIQWTEVNEHATIQVNTRKGFVISIAMNIDPKNPIFII